MFENMTPRERKLAMGVGLLMPVFLVLLIGTWYSNAYFGKRSAINSLQRQMSTEKQRQLEAQLANQRRAYYRAISLPADLNRYKAEYQGWLSHVANQSQLSLRTIDALPVEDKNYTGGRTPEKVYTKLPYVIRAEGTYDQILKFMESFYETEMLHRISYVSLTPRSMGTSGDKARIRSGRLSVEFRVEAVSLVDADPQRDFTALKREFPRPVEEYETKILARNIFGPANNTPSLSVSRSRTVTAGSEISYTLRATDADENDLLTFELVDCPIEGATLEQSSPTSRTAVFRAPAQPPGEYGPIRVRVTDNGFPPKSSEEEFSITVREPRVDPPPPPAPKFKHAGETTVTAILREKDGVWKTLIRIKTKGEYLKLAEGQSFELDDETWTIEKITPREVVIRKGNERLVYTTGDELTNPRSRTTIEDDDAKSNQESDRDSEKGGEAEKDGDSDSGDESKSDDESKSGDESNSGSGEGPDTASDDSGNQSEPTEDGSNDAPAADGSDD